VTAPGPKIVDDKTRWRAFEAATPDLMDYIRFLGGGQLDPDDIFQELSVIVARTPQVPADVDQFAAWCRGCVRNLVNEAFRKTKRRSTLMRRALAELVDQAFDEAAQSDRIAREEGGYSLSAQQEDRASALRVCLRTLRPEDRKLLLRRYGETRDAERASRNQPAAKQGTSRGTTQDTTQPPTPTAAKGDKATTPVGARREADVSAQALSPALRMKLFRLRRTLQHCIEKRLAAARTSGAKQ